MGVKEKASVLVPGIGGILGLGLIGLGLIFTPDTVPKHTAGPAVIMDVRDASLEEFAPAWAAEVQRRFPHSVMVLCHGGNVVTDEWVIADDPYGPYGKVAEPVDVVLTKEREEYPDRTIVLLSCNPCHVAIHGHPGCFYADASVWCTPDRALLPFTTNKYTLDGNRGDALNDLRPRSESNPDVVGNIFEFTEGN